MIYNLVPCDDPILFKPTVNFDFTVEFPIHPIELANNLIETMTHYKGLGLSANQCGLPYRVFVMWSSEPIACFNPRVVDSSEKIVSLEEGCLSFPELVIPIKRAQSVKVRFQDFKGETHTEVFRGMTARVFQHELDHLNGIDYTKRANDFHLKRAKNKQKIANRMKKRFGMVAK
jgi:peptide deformylase